MKKKKIKGNISFNIISLFFGISSLLFVKTNKFWEFTVSYSLIATFKKCICVVYKDFNCHFLLIMVKTDNKITPHNLLYSREYWFNLFSSQICCYIQIYIILYLSKSVALFLLYNMWCVSEKYDAFQSSKVRHTFLSLFPIANIFLPSI